MKFQRMDTDDGLSDGIILCTFKDSKGYIWFGTANGLNRFNGYDFEVYQHDALNELSISGNRIMSIVEIPSGDLLIGTVDGGLSIFHRDSENFSTYKFDKANPKSISANQVNSLLLDSKSNIWVGTSNGLDLFDQQSEQFEKVDLKAGVVGMVESKNGGIWIVTSQFEIHHIDYTGRITNTYEFLDQNTIESIFTVFGSDDGRIWIGTQDRGMYIFDPNTLTTSRLHRDNSGLRSNFVRAIFQDRKKQMWMGLDGAGINIYDQINQKWTYVNNRIYDEESLSSNAVYSIYGDEEDNFWVGTFKKGVNLYSPSRTKFTAYHSEPGNINSLSNNSVLGIDIDNQGNVWLGTDGGGLNKFNPLTGKFQNFKHDPDDPTSISSNIIKSVFVDHEGYIWTGTYLSGLNRYDPKTGEFKNFNIGPDDTKNLPFNSVWSIYEDSNDNMWFGFLGDGIVRFDRSTETFHHIRHNPQDENSFSTSAVFKMIEDGQGNMWLGSEYGGLNVMNLQTGKLKKYIHDPGNPSSLINDQIRAITLDKEGTIWIGTMAGLCKYDPVHDTFIPSSINSQLRFPAIYGIMADENGMLWLSGIQGLYRYNIKEDQFQIFDKFDGVQGEFNYTAQAEATNGVFYFGGLNGFNAFDPLEILENNHRPPVIISEFTVLGEPLQAGDTLNSRVILNKSLDETDGITLTHQENVFSLEFAALDFVAPERIRYSYKLAGFEDNWTSVFAENRQVTYMNLAPGQYVFHLRATNSDGIWSDQEKSLIIDVLPPWWSTLWFQITLVFVISAIIYLVFSYRSKRQAKIRNMLKQEVEEATGKLKLRNDELQLQQDNLELTVQETNYIIQEAVNSGDFSARISVDGLSGEWSELGQSINRLFESVLRPFEDINRVVNLLAKGDLTSRMPEDSNGDVKEVAINFNHALNNFDDLLGSITEMVDVIEKSMHEMRQSSEIMNHGTSEISDSTREMSKGAGKQVVKIDESSVMIERIREMSASVEEQARTINEMAQTGVEQSTSGKNVIGEVEESMDRIRKFSTRSNESIDILENKAKEISRVLSIINEIASQTNLLALNAAIEAAQAGEAGRGFAVVAEEIRKLAQMSKTSANEIDQLVNEVQGATTDTSGIIQEMVETVSLGDKASRAASTSFHEMADSFESTLSISQQIVSATQMQIEKVKEIVSSTENVVVIAEETAAGAEQIAASSAELSRGMVDYSEKTHEVGNIIDMLKERVKKFTLDRKQTAELEEMVS